MHKEPLPGANPPMTTTLFRSPARIKRKMTMNPAAPLSFPNLKKRKGLMIGSRRNRREKKERSKNEKSSGDSVSNRTRSEIQILTLCTLIPKSEPKMHLESGIPGHLQSQPLSMFGNLPCQRLPTVVALQAETSIPVLQIHENHP